MTVTHTDLHNQLVSWTKLRQYTNPDQSNSQVWPVAEAIYSMGPSGFIDTLKPEETAGVKAVFDWIEPYLKERN